MADLPAVAKDIVKTPIGWAKAKPWIFALFVLALVVVVIRFRETIAKWIAKIPFVGGWLTGLSQGPKENPPAST